MKQIKVIQSQQIIPPRQYATLRAFSPNIGKGCRMTAPRERRDASRRKS